MTDLQTGDTSARTLRFEFEKDYGRFVGLSLINFLLSVVTLSIWRFWGRTNVRKALWNRTRLLGDAFEYTGKGSELFFAFLAVIGVFIVVGLIVFGLTLMLGPLGGLVILALYVILPWLAYYALFAANRYRLTRTSWRGIRCNLGGSGSGYAWSAFGFTLLIPPTFGWIIPAMDWRLSRRILGGIYFGDRQFRFEGKPEGLYPFFFLAFIGGVIGAIFAGFVLFTTGALQDPEAGNFTSYLIKFFIAYAGAGLIASLLAAGYFAKFYREVIGCLRFEGLTFLMNVRTVELLIFAVTNALIVILSLGILVPLAQARLFNFVCRRVEAEGTVDFDAIEQNKDQAPRFGEGLAEAFDFGNVL